ncbi:MAG: hypothetical protein HY298_00235 [Verrucomicrobia bacterium]|nr:hypothetical protein [Verrucomicrobiota bacterium]
MKKLPANFLTLALVAFFAATLPLHAVGPTAAELAVKLDALKETVVAEVTAALKTNAPKTSYTTIWRDYEDAAIDALCFVLKKHVESLTDNNFDRGRSGKEKNRLADLAIVCGNQQIEVSIKTARRSANPENDMGTFHEHPARKKIFVASFTLWVRYDDAGKAISTDQVFFDRTWKFVGKSSLVDGVKYRKKDGNVRPKPWAMFDAGTAYWKTEEEFEAAVKRAEVYRANEVINEHLRELSEEDQRLLYERLKGKFGRETHP